MSDVKIEKVIELMTDWRQILEEFQNLIDEYMEDICYSIGQAERERDGK